MTLPLPANKRKEPNQLN